MKGKINSALITILIVGILIGYIGANKIGYRDFQKIRIEINKIRFQKEETNAVFGNFYSRFSIIVEYQVINTNEYAANISTLHSRFYFDVLSYWEIEDEHTEIDIFCGGEITGWDYILTIEKGTTNGTTIAHMKIYDQEVAVIPDGEYTFWMGLQCEDETFLNSIRCKLLMRNGESITENFIRKPTLTFSDSLAIAVSVVILIVLLKRKNHSSLTFSSS